MVQTIHLSLITVDRNAKQEFTQFASRWTSGRKKNMRLAIHIYLHSLVLAVNFKFGKIREKSVYIWNCVAVCEVDLAKFIFVFSFFFVIIVLFVSLCYNFSVVYIHACQPFQKAITAIFLNKSCPQTFFSSFQFFSHCKIIIS